MANARRRPATTGATKKPPLRAKAPEPTVDETTTVEQATTDVESEHLDTTENRPADVEPAPGAVPPEPVHADAGDNPAEGDSDADSTVPGDTDGDGELSKEEKDQLELDELDQTPFRANWFAWLKERGVKGPRGRILFPGEPITFTGNKKQGGIVLITQDIYRMAVPLRSRRPVFTLVARAGTTVPNHMVVTKANYNEATKDLLNEFEV